MKIFYLSVKGHWITKWVIAVIIAFILSAVSPAAGHSQAAEQDGYSSGALKEMHAKVDAYVFAGHADDLSEQGIHVTNTGPVGDVIEIGITDYSDKKADHFYELLGTKLVKVVGGLQAVTMDNAMEVASDNNISITSIDTPQRDGAEMAVTTIADEAVTAEAGSNSAPNGSNTAWIVVIAAAALGAIAFVGRKLMLSRK